VPFDHAITDHAALRRRYRDPAGGAVDKQLDHVDAGAAGFIARSPFFVLATGDGAGCDASPRGGPPGFVQVLDPHRLAWGDLAGNNRLDSAANLVAQPAVGLLFLVPGVDETLRVNGRATLTTDPAVLDRCAVEGRRPRVAIGVDVDESFLHCAKAFRRSGLWRPDAWLDPQDRPSAARILRDQLGLDLDAAVVEQALEQDYAATLWQSGGEPAAPPSGGP
jgi:uncharacterized protein